MFHVKQCKIRRNRSGAKGRRGVGSRSRKARLSGGRKGVCCGEKQCLGVRPERLCAPARGGEQGKHLKKGSPAEEKGGFERRAGKTGREERREDGTNMRKIALFAGRCAVDLHTSGRITAKMEKNRQKN